jgi:hypothetical protein
MSYCHDSILFPTEQRNPERPGRMCVKKRPKQKSAPAVLSTALVPDVLAGDVLAAGVLGRFAGHQLQPDCTDPDTPFCRFTQVGAEIVF